MERICHGDERWEEDEDEDEDEEEEALSFCDLPVKEKPQQDSILSETPMRSPSAAAAQTEDFDFNQYWPPPPSPPPMCAADELFFQGHMLPLRLSFSAENTQNHLFSRNLSTRSESMDHNMLRFRNGSSSSSSSRSHYSRSSSISNNSISIPTNSKARTQKNVFHSHPSPTPQIRSLSTSGHRSRSFSRWYFFRLGLLRTPGMELHDLKTRTSTTTSTSNSNSTSTSTSNSTTTAAHKTTPSFLGVVSCKKSVDTIPAAAAAAGAKNRRSESVKGNYGFREKMRGQKEKVLKVENREKEKEKEKESRVSYRRTFEWLKQLSHASFGDEQ